jgi:hypothetical protein
MSKTTFLGYVPSLKSKHEATIVGHKAIQSKGGSIRYTLQGEYDGRKTLPKTVSKADFESVYGFNAKEAESAIIIGKNKKGDVDVLGYTTDAKDKTGFTPEKIVKWDSKELKDLQHYSNHDADTVGFDYTKITNMVSQALADFKGGIPYSYEFEEAMRQMRHKMEDDIQRSDSELQSLADSTVKEMLRGKKKMNADTVGNPSPASVEPPAPSESPFPQEPSNETFSAHSPYLRENPSYLPPDEGWFQIDVKHKMEDGWEHYGDYDNEEDATSAYYDIYLNHPEVVLLEVDADGDGDVIYTQRNYNLDVKEAFGFGKKEEESEEPKTQEFTVVMQEGDKLELTDITEEEEQQPADDEPKEEDSPEESENEEKEAETLEITDIDWETDEEDVDLPASVLVPSSVVEDEIADYLSDEYGFLVRGYVLNAEYEAVQAKVTRPVKEEEEPEEESDEGLSTGAKVALGVGALAAGVAIFGAEGEYPQEFLDEFYDFDSNPTADTQDEETIAIAYAAWLESKKEEDEEARMLDETHSDIRDYIPYESETDYTEIYGATSGDGYINHDRIDTEEKRMVELRHDDPTTYYNWNSPYDVDESDVDDAVKDELGDEPGEGNYGATVEVLGSKYGENGQKYVDVDVDMDTDYGDSRFMGMAAETFESKGNMMVRLQEVDGEAPHYNCPYCRNELTVLGGKGGIVAVCENESRCNGLELPRQFLEDYEKYHWYVNERSSAENFSAEGTLCAVCNGNLDAGWWDCEKCGMIVCGDVDGESGFVECQTLDGMCKDCHPKDENWKMNFGADSDSKNLKMALGITAVGIGLAAVLGKDKIKTLFDRFGL